MQELNDFDLENMLEINPDMRDLEIYDIQEKIVLLKSINCSVTQIKNIITSNSLYFNRSSEEIKELMNYLEKKGFSCLNVLFDSNPYILNMDVSEIENYINNRIKNGEQLKDIIDDLDSNPILFFEIE